MREIKFEAWDPIEQKMIPASEITRYKFANFIGNWEEEGAKTVFLRQYTGLKDKNGKETYHKDIIKDSTLGELWLVEWSDEYACFELQRITENTIKVEGILETISACRIVDLGVIIGNIYENPELLEVKG